MPVVRFSVDQANTTAYARAYVKIYARGATPRDAVYKDPGHVLVAPFNITERTGSYFEATLDRNTDLIPTTSYYEAFVPNGRKEIKLQFRVPASGAGPFYVEDLLIDSPGEVVSSALSAHIEETTEDNDVHGSKTYTDDAIADVIGTAGAALDTLGELSDALGDDANFAATVTTNLASKASTAALTAETDARTAADEVLQDDIDTHEGRTDNPHSVTKAQVGLGNVDNTSDANKPVSTAQAAADTAVANAAAADATTKANQAETDANAYTGTYAAPLVHATRHHDSGADPLTDYFGRPDLDHEAYYQALFDGVTYKRAAIALRYDDCDDTNYSLTFPMLTARELVGGFALVEGLMGDAARLTYAQAKEMAGRGMEMMAHSRNHSDPTSEGDPWAYFVDEVVDATDDMRAQGLFMDSFVQPGPWTGDYYFDTVFKCDDARQGRLLRANYGAFEGYRPDDRYETDVVGLPRKFRYGATHVSGDTKSAATLTGIVDKAIRYGAATEVVFHDRNVGDPGFISLADYTTFLDYIKTKRDAGLIDVLTPTGLLYARQRDTKRNLVGDPGFEESAGSTFHPAWTVIGGSSPTVANVGHSGLRSAQVDSSNKLRQDWPWDNLRNLQGEAWVRAATLGTTPTARLKVVTYLSTTNHVDLTFDTVTSDDWQRVPFSVGVHPDSRFVKLELSGTSGTDVLFDDIAMWKV